MDRKFSMNLSWPTESGDREDEYQKWIRICQKANIGCIRVFLVPWGINPFESNDDLNLLCRIIQKAQEACIEVVLVIDTYVNYVMHTYRDFVDCEYSWNTNSFSSNRSLRTFLSEDGKTRYLEKVTEILRVIEPYRNVKRLELCNEIDQIGSNRKRIVGWINNSITELQKIFGGRFEFHVSISNHREYCYFKKMVNCRCDIHTYRFPYNTALENYKYLSSNYPDAWISEFAYYSDFAYSETIESKVYFSAMILRAYFERCSDFPAPWWWEKILSDPAYMSIYDYIITIDTLLTRKQTGAFEFKELEKKKQDVKLKNKIQYRLSVLKQNPFYIIQEFPAIRKYMHKKLHPQYNHSYAAEEYESNSGDLYIILETYVPIEVTCNPERESGALIKCIDLIRDQKMIPIKVDDTQYLQEGTYLFVVQK